MQVVHTEVRRGISKKLRYSEVNLLLVRDEILKKKAYLISVRLASQRIA